MYSMVDFLYGVDWKRFVEEKWMKMLKSNVFWAKTRKWYRYQRVVLVPLKLVLVPTGSERLVPLPVKVVPIPLLPVALFVHTFALLSPVFVYRLLGTLSNY